MKYFSERDNDKRAQVVEFASENPMFTARATFYFPPPSYKIYISNEELAKFGHDLHRKMQNIFAESVEELLKGIK
jgi:hypothetical protein